MTGVTSTSKTAARPEERSRARSEDRSETAFDVNSVDGHSTEMRSVKLTHLLLSLSKKIATFTDLPTALRYIVEVSAREVQADRASLFLNDPATNELYTQFAQGNLTDEIRIMNDSGVSGAVFQSGEPLIIHDPYSDPRFNHRIDQHTGYITKDIICVPVKTARGQTIGVLQALNKHRGEFNHDDLVLLIELTAHAAYALDSMIELERIKKLRQHEVEFLEVISEISSDINIESLLTKVMSEATRMLDAERSTLFLNDEKTDELWSQVGEGLGLMQIRLANHLGIAGSVFTSGTSINIPHAYADLRFNPAFDRKTGFFTRSILCVPIINKDGKTIGVTQVLNKKNGSFTAEDESRLKTFTAQIAISLENASLFADVQNIKNYNEGILLSMTNAVLTFDEEGRLKTCNKAGESIFNDPDNSISGKTATEIFSDSNPWLLEKIDVVLASKQNDMTIDADLKAGSTQLSANVTVMPLLSVDGKSMGFIVMIEDISAEKRMKSTMSRYIDPSIADRLLADKSDIFDGQNVHATILFSDIRGFTTLTEQLGPQDTVHLLNEYFEIMVDCISSEGGILDKFIGDAIMAGFGIPQSLDDDEDRGLRAALSMIRKLNVWNAGRIANGKLPLNIGIGLNSDNVVSGNIGSRKRMDYTMIGDGVNLAARLESACKQYNTSILISEFTKANLNGTYRMRDVDRVVVKGKTVPVNVYEVLDYHTEETFPRLMEVLNLYQEGIKHYRAMEWDDAATQFQKCLKFQAQDFLSEMYINRCKFLRENPPETTNGHWDGVWVLDGK
jgi:adenylate cyclase